MELKISKSTLRPFHETAIQDTVSTVDYGLLRFFSYVTWLSKGPDREGAGLWEQETLVLVVAGTNGSKTWEWVLACGQVWERLRGGH